MTSTRNKNTPGNYALEQAQYTHMHQHTMYEHGLRVQKEAEAKYGDGHSLGATNTKT
jgi:hypothetical protein